MYDIEGQALGTTSSTVAITSGKDSWLHELYLSNIGTASATVSVYDGKGFALIPSVVVYPNGGNISVNSAYGISMRQGVVWYASTTSVHGRGSGRFYL